MCTAFRHPSQSFAIMPSVASRWTSACILLLLIPCQWALISYTMPSRKHVNPLFSSEPKSDPVREANGARPSLHPIVINALSETLKIRAQNKDDMPVEVKDGVEPLQVAMSAGRIAADNIAKRQETSKEDDMALTPDEEQVIAGRIIGVVVRLQELESVVHKKCLGEAWIDKYNEWDSFGALKDEGGRSAIDDRILSDPLFAMNRAESLLAVFLETVEVPQLKKAEMEVPDNSQIDFLDEDRRKVLLDAP